MLRSTLARVLAASGLLASPLCADVHVVDWTQGPGAAYTSVQSAVDAAAAGDLILVRAGYYDYAVGLQGKAVSIVAEAGAKVTVGELHMDSVPAGMPIVLRGLTIKAPPPSTSGVKTPAIWIENTSADVLVEDCIVEDGYPCLEASNASSVSLVRCQFSGGFTQKVSFGIWAYGDNGVHAVGSTVRVLGGEIRGGVGRHGGPITPGNYVGGGAGASAIRVEGGEVYIQGATVIGGAGGNGTSDPFGCWKPGVGGYALWIMSGGGTVRVLDSVIEVGPSGVPISGCPPIGPGLATKVDAGVLSYLPGTGNEVTMTSPHREGETLSLDVNGVPGHLTAVLISQNTSSPFLPGVGSTLHVGQPFATVVLGVIPPGGSFSLLPVVPAAIPSLDWTAYFVQAMTCDPVTSQCRLGIPSAAALLDAGL